MHWSLATGVFFLFLVSLSLVFPLSALPPKGSHAEYYSLCDQPQTSPELVQYTYVLHITCSNHEKKSW